MSAITHVIAGVPVTDLVETYANGVRHVKVPGPDGNTIAFAELPS